jgi:hypothetical protein
MLAVPVNAQLPVGNSLIGTWLITVEGESATRTLVIAAEATNSSGTLLSAKYGISGKGQSTIEANVTSAGDRRQINLVTQLAAIITATDQPDGTFSGTFTFKSGVVKPMTMVRVTDAEQLAKLQPQPDNMIQRPGPEVPAGCAAFSGGWGGEWPEAGFSSLWVVSIDASCAAKVAYSKRVMAPTPKQTLSSATIKSGVLYLQRPDGGTTTFELNGDSVNARYNGPSGNNSTVMRRLDPDSTARLQKELTAFQVMVQPASDIPSGCAAFYGQWSGTWSQGGFGEQYLRVAEVKLAGDKCVARYSYGGVKTTVAKDTVEFSPDALTFLCNKSTGGTCIFERKGSELWASYSNPSGGRNSAVFRQKD